MATFLACENVAGGAASTVVESRSNNNRGSILDMTFYSGSIGRKRR